MSYTANLTANFGSYVPTLANVRVDVNGSTISSGISAIANTGGTAFEVAATLPDGFNGSFVFYDATDSTKYCVGSVSPNFDHTSDQVTTDAASRTASQADVSGLATSASVAALNNLAADEVWDEVIDGTFTGRQILRLLASFIAGKASGGGTTTVTFRSLADDRDRMVMTADVNGNRSAVTLDVT